MDAEKIYFLLTLLLAASIGVASGVSGAIYKLILLEPGHALSGWNIFVRRMYMKFVGSDEEKYFKYQWILKPIVECELCISGQIALWSFLIINFRQFDDYFFLHLFALIFNICLSILTAWAIAQRMNK